MAGAAFTCIQVVFEVAVASARPFHRSQGIAGERGAPQVRVNEDARCVYDGSERRCSDRRGHDAFDKPRPIGRFAAAPHVVARPRKRGPHEIGDCGAWKPKRVRR